MRMFRLGLDGDGFWFTADNDKEAVALAAAHFQVPTRRINFLYECKANMYPPNITVKGVAYVRGEALTAADIFKIGHQKTNGTWVITDNKGNVQEITR